MPITAFYASLLAMVFTVLSIRVIRARRGARVALGDGGDPILLRRIRVHANFAEYVPFAVVLIGLAESVGTDGRLLHVLGSALFACRCLHAYGVSQDKENLTLRVLGMASTFTIIIVAALACGYGSFVRAFGIGPT